jgi:hypothetical protein
MKIVYHGAREHGIKRLKPNWPPPGGIGYGIYVTDDIEVARFYAGSGSLVYQLELLIDDKDILFIGQSEDTGNYDSVPGTEGQSVLVGEHVEPFSFWIGEDRYTVGFDDSTEDVARAEIIIYQLDDVRHKLPKPIDDALQAYIDNRRKYGEGINLEDFTEYEMENLVDWEEMNALYKYRDFIENKDDFESIKDGVRRLFKPIEDGAEEAVKRSIGLVIDLMDIGQEAEAHGYKAVKMEGVRGSFPDTEILVFDPDDLKMIGEVEE